MGFDTIEVNLVLPHFLVQWLFAQWKLMNLEDDLKKEKDPNTSLAAKGALAHLLQRRTACKIQNGRQGAPKWPPGSGKVSNPRFLGILSNFRYGKG